MKYIAILILTTLFVFNATAQEPAMLVPTSTNDFVFKVDKESGKIDLFKGDGQEAITSKFTVSALELEIFDAKGEYAGTLELSAFTFPKEEVESYENLKIASLTLTDTATGEKIVINDVAVLEK